MASVFSQKISLDDGIISYCESGQNGFPVVLIHGNSLSALTFKKQLEDPHLSGFRLIAIDLPGHGESGKWDYPQKNYSVSSFIETLLKITDILKVQNAVFAGHSFGGHLVLNTSEYLTEASGILLFGCTPFRVPRQMERAFFPHPALNNIFKSDLSQEEFNIVEKAFVKKDSYVPAEISNSLRIADPDVRGLIGVSFASSADVNEAEKLEKTDKPVAIFHGESDQLINGDYFTELTIPTLWNNEITIIKNSGHSPQLENPSEFNNQLGNFIRHCLNKSAER